MYYRYFFNYHYKDYYMLLTVFLQILFGMLRSSWYGLGYNHGISLHQFTNGTGNNILCECSGLVGAVYSREMVKYIELTPTTLYNVGEWGVVNSNKLTFGSLFYLIIVQAKSNSTRTPEHLEHSVGAFGCEPGLVQPLGYTVWQRELDLAFVELLDVCPSALG